MSNQSIGLSDALHRYLLDVSVDETEVQERLRHETMQHPHHDMQIAPEQGQFMEVLVRLMGAERAIEIGVFTGYSALAIAYALPETGTLVACDINTDYTGIAERYWAAAGVTDRIDLRIAPAIETLKSLRADEAEGTFDFAFIDADKTSYAAYYEHSLALLRSGGLILFDNMLQEGRVIDDNASDDNTQAIQALNRKLSNDDRVYVSLIPVADGITLALKK